MVSAVFTGGISWFGAGVVAADRPADELTKR
jgi:hypothetical protein